MDDMRVLRDWGELQRLCDTVSFSITTGNGHIALHYHGITAHKTKDVASALGFMQGYIAGTKEDY